MRPPVLASLQFNIWVVWSAWMQYSDPTSCESNSCLGIKLKHMIVRSNLSWCNDFGKIIIIITTLKWKFDCIKSIFARSLCIATLWIWGISHIRITKCLPEHTTQRRVWRSVECPANEGQNNSWWKHECCYISEFRNSEERSNGSIERAPNRYKSLSYTIS